MCGAEEGGCMMSRVQIWAVRMYVWCLLCSGMGCCAMRVVRLSCTSAAALQSKGSTVHQEGGTTSTDFMHMAQQACHSRCGGTADPAAPATHQLPLSLRQAGHQARCLLLLADKPGGHLLGVCLPIHHSLQGRGQPQRDQLEQGNGAVLGAAAAWAGGCSKCRWHPAS